MPPSFNGKSAFIAPDNWIAAPTRRIRTVVNQVLLKRLLVWQGSDSVASGVLNFDLDRASWDYILAGENLQRFGKVVFALGSQLPGKLHV